MYRLAAFGVFLFYGQSMHGYVGHYRGDPTNWFFVLADSPEQAIDFIDGEWGEAEPLSLRRVKESFAVQFATRIEDDGEGKFVECEADTPPISLGEGPSGTHDWILECMLKPVSPSPQGYAAVDAVVGKRMPEPLRSAVERGP